MDKVAVQMLSALRAERNDAAYRKDLLEKVEDLWAKDAQFRYAIRGLLKNSKIKDTRGNKSAVDVELTQALLTLGGKLGLTQKKVLELLAHRIEPESIKQSLLRKQKKPSQST